MVDGTNIISLKIKSFDGNVHDEDQSLESEQNEEEIFYDVIIEDRICAQCGHDHSFKSNFKGVKTSIEQIPELILIIFKGVLKLK